MKKSELRQLIREELSKLNETKFYVFWNGQKYDIEGKDLLDAKTKAIVQFKVPKSKQPYLAILSQKAYDDQQFRFD